MSVNSCNLDSSLISPLNSVITAEPNISLSLAQIAEKLSKIAANSQSFLSSDSRDTSISNPPPVLHQIQAHRQSSTNSQTIAAYLGLNTIDNLDDDVFETENNSPLIVNTPPFTTKGPNTVLVLDQVAQKLKDMTATHSVFFSANSSTDGFETPYSSISA